MDPSPYYAPSYFPPTYFSAPDMRTDASSVASPYYAPSYFPPAYFYGFGKPEPDDPASPVPQGRDGPAYAALLSLLRASGSFEAVVFGDALQRGRAGADAYPLAVLTPRGWEESDDFDPSLIVRRVSFTITIVLKSPSGESDFAALDRLASRVQDAIEHTDLGGTSLPALTRIRAGRYGTGCHHPEQSVELDGGFATIIEP